MSFNPETTGRTIAELARHKSFETTQRYLLVVDAQRRAAVDAMAGLLPTRSGSSGTRPVAHAPAENSRTPRKRLKSLASPG